MAINPRDRAGLIRLSKPVGGRTPMPPPGRLGETNVDLEASMNHDAYQVEPDPLGQTVSTPLKSVEIPIPEAPGVVPGGLDSRKFVSVLERAYGKPIIRNILVPPAVAGQAPVRLDSGRGNRAEITLHNLGDFDLWFAYSQQMTVGNAELLPGAPVPGSLLGGFISIALRTDVEVWGLAAAAAPAAGIMVVVSEFGL